MDQVFILCLGSPVNHSGFRCVLKQDRVCNAHLNFHVLVFFPNETDIIDKHMMKGVRIKECRLGIPPSFSSFLCAFWQSFNRLFIKTTGERLCA